MKRGKSKGKRKGEWRQKQRQNKTRSVGKVPSSSPSGFSNPDPPDDSEFLCRRRPRGGIVDRRPRPSTSTDRQTSPSNTTMHDQWRNSEFGVSRYLDLRPVETPTSWRRRVQERPVPSVSTHKPRSFGRTVGRYGVKGIDLVEVFLLNAESLVV